MRKAHKILCCECRTPLYWYRGEFNHGQRINPKDFEPVTSGIPKPASGEAMMCVKCGSPWYMVTHKGSLLVLTTEGIKPRAPGGTPRVFTPDPVGYIKPELPYEFRDTEYKEPR